MSIKKDAVDAGYHVTVQGGFLELCVCAVVLPRPLKIAGNGR